MELWILECGFWNYQTSQTIPGAAAPNSKIRIPKSKIEEMAFTGRVG
jgi:hypothetical protein